MDKIKKYLFVELANLKSERDENLRNIYRGKLNIESIDEAIKKIRMEQDSTGDVFKPSESKADDDREILSLCERKESIQRDIDVLEKRIVCIDKKMEQLAELQNDEASVNIDGYQMLSIRENERQRISRDIHDSVLQKMTALIHKTEFTQKVMDSDVSRAKLELEIVNKVMRECVDELRDIVYNLRPMALDDIGFKETLERYVNQCSSMTDMNITLNLDNLNDDNIDNIIQITAFRIIQELTGNSIKHSEGNNINITIYTDKDNLVIEHADDGNGYSDENSVVGDINTGFGLAIIKERVKLLNGDIQCEHTDGTKNVITIPINIMEA